MEQNVDRDQRIMWAFWIAAGLAAIGALAPLAFSAGAHSRLASVAIPFGVAATALAANAVLYQQGRTMAVSLYFVAGLAIVYGILAMLAVPLRLAVVGTCPAAPAHCPIGFEPPLTSGENSGLGTATFCGILAIFIGFYGLVMLYRRRRAVGARPDPTVWPAQPPVQTVQGADAAMAAVAPAAPAPTPVAEPVPPAPVQPAPAVAAADPPPTPAPKPAARVARKKAAAASVPVPADELKELPAPQEPKELPPPA